MRLPITILLSCIPSALASGIIPSPTEQDSSIILEERDVDFEDGEGFLTIRAESDLRRAYQVKAAFGSPAQSNNLRVDIAQPYLWLLNSETFPSCSEIDVNATETEPGYSPFASDCVDEGHYSMENSSTANNYIGTWERLLFLNYVIANGTVVNDNAEFFDFKYNEESTNLTAPEIDFILANASNVFLGALGLAALDHDDINADYDINFINIMRETGRLNSSSYTWFAKNESELLLTFGGINRSHYIEPLVEFETIPYYDIDTQRVSYSYPIVPLTSLTVNNNAVGSSVFITEADMPFPVLLDSRSTYTRLPYSTVIDLAIQLNAIYSDQQRLWYVKCSMGDLDATVGFTFGNVTIQVPISAFIASFSTSNESTVVFENGEKACYMTVAPNTNYGYSVLGQNFLQSVFFAVEHEGSKIALAQSNNDYMRARANPDESNVVTTRIGNSTEVITTTVSQSSLPIESSSISSGFIPFATTNNVTQTMTFSYQDQFKSSRAVPPEISGVYSSGTVYTGRYINTTTSQNTTLSAFGYKNTEFGNWNKMGLLGMISFVLFSFAL